MDADNYFKVFKAWGLLLILSLLKFSSFFISVDSQYAFFSLLEVTCLIKTPLRVLCRKSSGFSVIIHKSA